MDKVHLTDENFLIDKDDDDDYIANINKKYSIVESIDGNNYVTITENNFTFVTSDIPKEETFDKIDDDKTKTEIEIETDAGILLGSVTTHTHNCMGTRSSARVIQKMKQDQQIHPGTPPHERDREKERDREIARKDDRLIGPRAPTTQIRPNKQSWSNTERNYFFDALNEFGKDFEAIGNYVNSKLKKRNPNMNITLKSKDQVRQHFYQTYHKISKYVRFSEEVRKPVQELYALINYGEMRRKIQFITEKHFSKLRNLVYDGHVTVRCKGKNIRIKTPSCKALRRINKLDDSLEDIRLPSKIEVTVSPANMEAFGYIQTIAQNPRCRTTVPLHKKLINFIKAFQYKWRNYDYKLIEEVKLLNNTNDSTNQYQNGIELNYAEPELCFLPKPGIAIHRPLLSITEYLSSVNICLTAYEERMGVKVKSITLNGERSTILSSAIGNTQQNGGILCNKRVRTDSGSDKRASEQMKRSKVQDSNVIDTEDTGSDVDLLLQKIDSDDGDEACDELHELLTDYTDAYSSNSKNCILHLDGINKQIVEENNREQDNKTSNAAQDYLNAGNKDATASGIRSTKRPLNTKSSKVIFKPMFNDDVIQTIRNGWTTLNAGDLTIGDLYVVFGHDGKLELDYYWPKNKQNSSSISKWSNVPAKGNSIKAITSEKDNGNEQLTNEMVTCTISNKLKHLLLIANLNDRLRKRCCMCERNPNVKIRLERDATIRTLPAIKPSSASNMNSDVQPSAFKSPLVPLRRPSVDPVKQLTNLTRQKVSRQVFVKRLLGPNTNSSNIDNCIADNHNFLQADDNLAMRFDQTSTDIEEDKVNISESDGNNGIELFSNRLEDKTSLSLSTLSSSSLNRNIDEMPKIAPDIETTLTTQTMEICPTIHSSFDDASNNSFLSGINPLQLLRESTSNSRWLEENINDFSLTSLLGHLDEINASRDSLDPSSNLSVISESSVDYMHKFQEIKALLQSQDTD